MRLKTLVVKLKPDTESGLRIAKEASKKTWNDFLASLLIKQEVIPSGNTGNTKAQDVVALYCEHFKAAYGSQPIITGRDAGIAKRLIKTGSIEAIAGLMTAYFKMRDPWFITKRHDLATFEGNLNAIKVFLESGKTISRKEIQQIDQNQAFENTLNRIKEGKL